MSCSARIIADINPQYANDAVRNFGGLESRGPIGASNHSPILAAHRSPSNTAALNLYVFGQLILRLAGAHGLSG
jgi:hypothetical protein